MNNNMGGQQSIFNFMQPANNSQSKQKENVQQQKQIVRKFVNTNLISKHLLCTICQEVFNVPIRINCAHTFCTNCITQWSTKNSACPICRQKFILKDFTRDLIASNMIDDLEVICNNNG
jgi:hypothetical protein